MKSLDEETLQKLRSYADSMHFLESSGEKIADFKIYMNKKKLVSIIGTAAFKELEETFSTSYDEIILRRCSSHGKFINFYTDASLKTMQVAINGDDEYVGGRLVYATNEGLEAPERPAGTVTIHHDDIVHGVSLFESGTRYELFFLK